MRTPSNRQSATRAAWATLCALALWASLAAAQDIELIDMFVGEIKILPLGGIERVAVGSSKVVSTSALKSGQLVLLGESKGITSLHIWFKDGTERDYTISVGETFTKKNTGEVRQLLAEIPGIDVREVGERIVLTGQIPAEYEVILETVKAEFKDIMDLTRKSAPVLPGDKMVFMDVKFTEFNTSRLQELGIEWDTSIAGPTGGASVPVETNELFRVSPITPAVSFADVLVGDREIRGFFGIASEITSRINLLASSGDALILAQPLLSARSGGEAEFLSGGELPIPTTGALGQTNVEFKEFGIKLTISPVVDAENNIVARVATEVSSIDSSVSVGGIPGFLTRKTDTDISMRAGETLVISGLVNHDIAEDVTKLKFFGDIPVLGALFRSTNFRNRKSELVIFVTPTVVDAHSTQNQSKLTRQREMLDEFRKVIDTEDIGILE